MEIHSFKMQIVCRSGVLCVAHRPDFLDLVRYAMQERQWYRQTFPFSTVRVQVFYPNGVRCPQPDLVAAVKALRALSVRK
jgi:hypothetical protein